MYEKFNKYYLHNRKNICTFASFSTGTKFLNKVSVVFFLATSLGNFSNGYCATSSVIVPVRTEKVAFLFIKNNDYSFMTGTTKNQSKSKNSKQTLTPAGAKSAPIIQTEKMSELIPINKSNNLLDFLLSKFSRNKENADNEANSTYRNTIEDSNVQQGNRIYHINININNENSPNSMIMSGIIGDGQSQTRNNQMTYERIN